MGGFLLGEFMSNTYRLDIQVNADSANTALGNLKEHFDKIEQSSGKASVGINGFSDKADKASKSSKKAGDEAKKSR
ncbi:TP901 family phage tail tape measure protein [Moraxella catarrhalis 12P80B1]|nr:TP901 family phage tail tape measure protein [Moraxella catarrhalis 12P80B1]